MRGLVFAALIVHHAAAGGEEVFPEDSAWETVSSGHEVVEGIAAGADGAVFLTDVPGKELFKLDKDGRETLLDGSTDGANGLATGPDGRLFGACMNTPAIAIWNPETKDRSMIPLPTPANDLAITAAGALFYTWGPSDAVYHLDIANPQPRKLADMPNPNGITISHDGRELFVGEFFGNTVRAFPILDGGKLGPARAAFRAKAPENGKGLLDGMTPLRDGRLLVATALGLQILSTGAEPVVLPNPTDQRANYVRIITDSAGVRWIYAAHVKTVLRRKTLL
jgi:sugar lactone lactonase YvrE